MDSSLPKKPVKDLPAQELIKPVPVKIFLVISVVLGLALFGSALLSFSPMFPAWFITGGIIFATFVLASIWVALGTGPYWKRLVGSFCCGAIVSLALPASVTLIAMTAYGDGLRLNETLFMMSSGPIFWLIIQIPFWIARVGFGWRIGMEQHDETNFRIVDIMAFTVLVAFSFAALNFAGNMQSAGNVQSAAPSPIQVFSMSIISLVITMIFSAAIGLPAVALLLKRPQRIRTGQKLDQFDDSTGKGCGIYFFVILLVSFVPALILGISSAGVFRIRNSNGAVIMMIIVYSVLLFCTAFFIALPLLAIRESGMTFFRIQKSNAAQAQ